MRLWFLSLLGPQQPIKALWARLVQGELATFSREALGQVHFCDVAPDGPPGWRAHTARLPGASGYQLLLLPQAVRHTASREGFLLLPRTADEAPSLHFRFLDRRGDLPLHVGWSDWLWHCGPARRSRLWARVPSPTAARPGRRHSPPSCRPPSRPARWAWTEGEAVHVVLWLKAEIHDRAALTRAALAPLERVWDAPGDEDRRALADPARALYELLWASHPSAGPRQAGALGFEVVESEYETHDPPEPAVGRAR
jgi:hypothetical protein